MKRAFLFFCIMLTALSLFACDTPSDPEDNQKSIVFYVDGSIYHSISTAGNEIITLPPAPFKEGYEFIGWQIDENPGVMLNDTTFSDEPLLNDITVKAVFQEAEPEIKTARYTVEHYLQDLNDPTKYHLDKKESLLGEEGKTVHADVNSYLHFTATNRDTYGTVAADGSLVIKVYYERRSYNVTFLHREGELVSGESVQLVKYGAAAEAPIYQRAGYTYSFDKDFDSITGNTVVNVVWTPDPDASYCVIYYKENPETHVFEQVETLSLTAPVGAFVTAPSRNYGEGYEQKLDMTPTGATVMADGSTVIEIWFVVKTYTVTFVSDLFANESGIVRVAHGAAATAPNYSVDAGYDLHFDKDFSSVTSDMTVNVTAVPRNDTPYYVTYYLANGQGGYYEAKTVTLYGTTDSAVTVIPENYLYHTLNEAMTGELSGTVDALNNFRVSIYYDRIYYNVTISAEDEHGNPFISEKEGGYSNFDTVEIHANPAKGYIFDGWFDGDELVSTDKYYYFNPTKDVHLQARWTPDPNNTYYVLYFYERLDMPGWYNDLEPEERILCHGTTDTPITAPTPEKYGYVLDTQYYLSRLEGTVSGYGDTELKVFYKRGTYEVTFAGGGGSLVSGRESVTVRYGEGVTPPTYERAGYTFKAFDADLSAIGESLTVTALWTPRDDTPYRVEYYLENLLGGYTLSMTESLFGLTDSTVMPTPKDIVHFTFDEKASIPSCKVTADGNGVVKLFYKINRYTVNVESSPLAGGSVSGGGSYAYGESVILSALAKQGYAFDGWYIDGKLVSTETEYGLNPQSDVTVVAKFTPKADTKYTVKYYIEALDGSYTLFDTREYEGVTASEITAPLIAIKHFTYEKQDSETGVILPDGSLVLEVYYTRNSYRVVFYAAGGRLTNGASEQTVKYEGSAIAPTYQRNGYIFDGFDADFTNVSSDITVNVKWKPMTNVTYKVNYYLQKVGGIGYELYQSDKYTDGVSDAVISAEIKVFEHFTFDENNENNLIRTTVSPDGDTILSVYYSRNKYKVTFDGNGGKLISGDEVQYVYYQGAATSPVYEKGGYALSGYDKNIGSITGDISVKAVWGDAMFILDGNGYITGLNDVCKDLTVMVIPEEMDGVAITGIGYRALQKATNLKVLVIPNTVTYMQQGSLYGLGRLEEITLPFADFTSDGKMWGMGRLFGYNDWDYGHTSVSVNQQATDSRDIAKWCEDRSVALPWNTTGNAYAPRSLRKITVTGTYNDIYNVWSMSKTLLHAFNGLKMVEEIVIDCDVEYIAKAFVGCTNLKKVTLPAGVKVMTGSFEGCSSLETIVIPGGLEIIGERLFRDCISLRNIEIPESVTVIGKEAFAGCTALSEITIPGGVVEVRESAFAGCTGLRRAVFEEGVESIGTKAFNGCANLISVTIPESMKTISSDAFKDCYRLRVIYNDSSLQYVFGSYCKIICKTTDPDPLKITEDGLFAYYCLDGEYYLFAYLGDDTDISLPDYLDGHSYKIEKYAFRNMPNLTSVKLGMGVTHIGEEAFLGCTGLTEVDLRGSVVEVGYYAYSGCTSVSTVIVGETVEKILTNAFANCPISTVYDLSEYIETPGPNDYSNGYLCAKNPTIYVTLPE